MAEKIKDNKIIVQFYPLDIDYKTDENGTAIYIYGKTKFGEKICIKDIGFKPYFYVLPKEQTRIREFEEAIKKLEIKLKNRTVKIFSTSIEKKKYLAKEYDVIKVILENPKDVKHIRDKIKEWPIMLFDDDIKFVRRYCIDKDLTFLKLTQVEGKISEEKARVPVILAENIKQFDETIEEINPLAFDIETYNPKGKSVDPENNPIIMISFYGKNFKKVITWKRFKTKHDWIEFVSSERELIERFKEIINDIKPDVLIGYFTSGFDLPYIIERAKRLNIKLDIGLDYSQLSIKKSAVKISGIPHIDIFQFVFRILSRGMETTVLTLSEVASEILNEKKLEVDLNRLANAWDKASDDLEVYCEYNLQDSILVYKLFRKMWPNIEELVKLISLPIADIPIMGYSQLVEWYIIKRLKEFNELIPERPHHDEIDKRRMQTYEGAFVKEPEVGLHENIVVFDFRSLYPSIISSHNIGPDTIRCECCPENKVPLEEDIWFCKKRKGFIPTIINDLIERRIRIKELLKKAKHDVLLEARAEALKVITNTFYGYLGFFAARWYCLDCVKSITAYGRYYIKKVIQEAQQNGFEVIYSDTDSIFIKLKDKKEEHALAFLKKINNSLPETMELEYEGYYPRAIFVSARAMAIGAKKKYALIDKDGNIKVVGFEAIRRNWSLIAKETQERVLEYILKENDPEKALNYAKEVIEKIRKRAVPIEKMIISTQLQKEITQYEAYMPHLAIAKRMEQAGEEVRKGMLINFVVASGSGKVRDRARLPEEIENNNYDVDYYINNQVLPAIEKIFEVIGYGREKLLESKEQEKLSRFVNNQ